MKDSHRVRCLRVITFLKTGDVSPTCIAWVSPPPEEEEEEERRMYVCLCVCARARA